MTPQAPSWCPREGRGASPPTPGWVPGPDREQPAGRRAPTRRAPRVLAVAAGHRHPGRLRARAGAPALRAEQAGVPHRGHRVRRRRLPGRRHPAHLRNTPLSRLRVRAAAGDPATDGAGRRDREGVHGDARHGRGAAADGAGLDRVRVAGGAPGALPRRLRHAGELRHPRRLPGRHHHGAHADPRAVDEPAAAGRRLHRLPARPARVPAAAALGRRRDRVRRGGQVLGGAARARPARGLPGDVAGRRGCRECRRSPGSPNVAGVSRDAGRGRSRSAWWRGSRCPCCRSP